MAASVGCPFFKKGADDCLVPVLGGIFTLSRNLLNGVVMGSDKKSARICNIKGLPGHSAVANEESSLCTAALVKSGAFIIADGSSNDGVSLPTSLR